MSSPATSYVQGIHQKFNFYAAWPVNQPRKLGDVGRLSGGQFQRLTSLADLGVSFVPRSGPPGTDLSHTSGSSVEVQLKAEGQPLPGASINLAKAGAAVEFSASGAFVFQAVTPAVTEIENQVRLAEDILNLFRDQTTGKRKWQEDWCVVTELLSADKVTVLISNSKSSRVELEASGTLPAGPAPLASAGAGLKVVSQKGDVTSVLAETSLTPMFRVSRVRRSVLDKLFGGDSSADLVRAAVTSTTGAPKRVFEAVPIDEALAPATKARPATRAKSAVAPRTKRKTKIVKKTVKKAARKTKAKKAPAGRTRRRITKTSRRRARR